MTAEKLHDHKDRILPRVCAGLSLDDLEDAAAQPDHRKRLAKLAIAAWKAYRRSVKAYKEFIRKTERGRKWTDR